MPQVQSANFEQIFVGTSDGLYNVLANLTDLSQFMSEASYKTNNDPTDQTTFGPSGNSPAEDIRRGALDGKVTIKVLFDPTVNFWMQQVWGKPDGFIFIGYSGSNAAPQPGDEVFIMSSILLTPPLNYVPNQVATYNIDLMPVDGGQYAPDFYRF